MKLVERCGRCKAVLDDTCKDKLNGKRVCNDCVVWYFNNYKEHPMKFEGAILSGDWKETEEGIQMELYRPPLPREIAEALFYKYGTKELRKQIEQENKWGWFK